MAKVTNPGVDDVNVPAFGLVIPAGASVEVTDAVGVLLAGGPLTVEADAPPAPPTQTPPEQPPVVAQEAPPAPVSEVPAAPVQEAPAAPEAPKEQS